MYEFIGCDAWHSICPNLFSVKVGCRHRKFVQNRRNCCVRFTVAVWFVAIVSKCRPNTVNIWKRKSLPSNCSRTKKTTTWPALDDRLPTFDLVRKIHLESFFFANLFQPSQPMHTTLQHLKNQSNQRTNSRSTQRRLSNSIVMVTNNANDYW